MANFPTSVPTVDQLHTGVNNLRTNLNGDIDAIQATITVVSTANFPSVGAITIDAERISYTGLNATQFTGCTRGYGSTGAILHLSGAVVSLTFGAEYHNDVRDEVIAIAQNLSDRIGLGSTQVLAINGTNLLPSISFKNAPSFGMYTDGVNSIRFATNGTERVRIIDTALQIGNIQVQGQVGTVALPSFSFELDTDTGMYRRGVDSLGFVRNGTIGLVVDSFGTICKAGQLGAQYGTVAAPGITFENDLDTGFYRSFANRIAFSSGGNARFDFGSNLVAVNPTATIGRIGASDGAVTTPGFFFSSDTNTGIYSYLPDTFAITTGGVGRFWIDTAGNANVLDRLRVGNGSAVTPSYAFSSDNGTGMFRSSAAAITFATNTSAQVDIIAGAIVPSSDNTKYCGITNRRWVAVYAVNGTIQTSHSSTKTNIKQLENTWVPPGITYERDGKKMIGILNDDVPTDARPINDNISHYDGAIIGMLCNAVRSLQTEIIKLKAQN